MLDYLNQIDTNLFVFLNGLHLDFLDPIMLFLSYNKAFMGVIFIAALIHATIKFKKKAISIFILALIAFGLSDSISSRVFKPNFKRLRPCHQEELKEKVYLANKKCWGGKYGFVSSHASNSFAIAIFFFLVMKSPIYWLMILHAALVSYSRVYLAKHFPGDIFFGAILGTIIAFICYAIFKKLTTDRVVDSLK